MDPVVLGFIALGVAISLWGFWPDLEELFRGIIVTGKSGKGQYGKPGPWFKG